MKYTRLKASQLIPGNPSITQQCMKCQKNTVQTKSNTLTALSTINMVNTAIIGSYKR